MAARKGSLQDVVSLYYFVQKLPRLLQVLQAHGDAAEEEEQAVRERFTAPLQEAHGSFEQLLNLVETAVDLEAARRHEYVLHASLDPSLRELGVRKEEAYDEIAAHYEEMQSVFGLDDGKLKLECSGQWGYVLRVTRKDEKMVRENKKACKDVSFLQTKKEGVLFRDKKLAGLAEDYMAVQREYQAAQAEIAKQVVEMATTYTPVVQDCVTLLAELDVLLCFAHVSMTAPEPYVRPKLVPPQDDRQRIVLRGCRHPCAQRIEPTPCARTCHARAMPCTPYVPAAGSLADCPPAWLLTQVRRADGGGVLHQERHLPRLGRVVAPGRHGAQHGRQVHLHPCRRRQRPPCAGGPRGGS